MPESSTALHERFGRVTVDAEFDDADHAHPARDQVDQGAFLELHESGQPGVVGQVTATPNLERATERAGRGGFQSLGAVGEGSWCPMTRSRRW
ncbi:hypothetical protein [Nocardia sp. NPDC057455]|uniref:hypothetical protein n=1 Tax=Nocardia sp. NPDC057455 TaxID=3346138 RepID=UPI003670B7AE